MEQTTETITSASEETKQALTEEQEALKLFTDTLNLFKKKVEDYQGYKSEIKQVLINLVSNPVVSDSYHLNSFQTELFDLGTTINSTKYFLMLAGLQKQGKILITKDAGTEAVNNNLNGENTNG